MSDSREPNSDLGEDQDILNYLMEFDHPYSLGSGGDVPEEFEGTEGTFRPRVEDFVKGARLAAEANRRFAEARTRVNEERVRMLFQQREEQR